MKILIQIIFLCLGVVLGKVSTKIRNFAPILNLDIFCTTLGKNVYKKRAKMGGGDDEKLFVIRKGYSKSLTK